MTTHADAARVEAFAERLFGAYTGAALTLMVDVAHRTGLLTAAATGPGTSAELAARAGLSERYVRECLGALVTGGVMTYDADTQTYTLPPEHAVCLTGDGSLNLAPFSLAFALMGKTLPEVAQAFHDGGGVPYEKFRPEFTSVMDGMSRGLFDEQLIDGILPLTGALTTRLDEGAAVAEIGCGTGHSTNLMARAFPQSTFVGYDIADDALARARAEAAELGLTNVRFERHDVAHLPSAPLLDAVFAFDCIHDQVDPAAVLASVHAALSPNGVFVMMDTKASSRLERNVDNPFATLLYAFSTLHCMTVSLAHGGAGLGTVWGEELARQMLGDAGFVDVKVYDVPDDPLDSVFVSRRG